MASPFHRGERLVRFTPDEGRLVKNAMPIRWRFLEYSLSLEQTGSLGKAAATIAAREAGNVYRNYQAARGRNTPDAGFVK